MQRKPATLRNGLETGMPRSAPPAGTLAQLTAQVANPERRVFPGLPLQLAQVRRFVARALDGCPVLDEAVLCVSELASNAIVHTRTGQGGRFEVVVWRGPGSACVAVIDDGSETRPAPRRSAPGDLAESGHGLAVVQNLTACWGHHRYQDGAWQGAVVWFRIDWSRG
jgi:anti-sigma regulatory factor (Ser/Thr protein kinase)